MDAGAQVSEITALRDWLAALSQYRTEANNTLAGVELELRHGLDWVEQQGWQWSKAVREYEEDVVQAKAALAAKKFPNWDGKMPDTTVEERNLRRAEARLEHAQDQVRRCKAWVSKLPKHIDEMYTGPARRLGGVLEAELPAVMAHLDRRIGALEQYAGMTLETRTGGGGV
jgi:hypothetical protein